MLKGETNELGNEYHQVFRRSAIVCFFASLLSERLLISVVGVGGITDILVNISKNVARMRFSNLVAMLNSVGIMVLGVMFYNVFHKEHKIIALVALGCFLAEAITLTISKIGAYALIPLSQEFVEVGAPASSRFQTQW